MKHSLSAIFVYILVAILSTACSGEMNKAAGKPHHAANGFINPHQKQQSGFWDLMEWRWDRMFKDIPGPDDYFFPVIEVDIEFLNKNRTVNSVTWIGHATLLMQLSGFNVLTDPQFSQRASPVQWVGPERVVRPGVSVSDLPEIDYVVISHDHYDSLDVGSIEALFNRKEGERTTFIVPLGLKSWFQNLGITRVIELDWWESYTQDNITFTAVPTQHWSKRYLFSGNSTLWAAWVVKTPGFNFYFCGDSGYYAPIFKEVGKKMGPFDLAAIPIGAYEPRWFMKDKHVNPEEAVQVHLDLKAKRSVGIHWGTFILSDEPLDEPPQKLSEALNKFGVSKEIFMLLKHGETIHFDE